MRFSLSEKALSKMCAVSFEGPYKPELFNKRGQERLTSFIDLLKWRETDGRADDARETSRCAVYPKVFKIFLIFSLFRVFSPFPFFGVDNFGRRVI